MTEERELLRELIESFKAELNRVSRELTMIRTLVSDVVNYARDAESEVPEKVRRFVTYMHDVHDITYMYEQRGLAIPEHVLREMERCDDRFRQIVREQHVDGGAFEKVRRGMAADPDNRWDHTKLLYPPKEKPSGKTVEPKSE